MKYFYLHSTLLLAFIIVTACSSQEKPTTTMDNDSHDFTNRLIEASSPYLLQHSHNPVNWYPWGEEALTKAKEEDKPIIVSIGYSACHWCHVMERESFENDSIAAIMNKHFVCIKVDREERPDVDQVYMDAVQAMGLNGGWPLNVFLTPDQKPFYGGTYFPPKQWTEILQNVSKAFAENRNKLEESAEQFAKTLSASEIEKYGLTSSDSPFEKSSLDFMYSNLAQRFDRKNGGIGSAPKFPMPSNWKYLLRYYKITEKESALRQINKTLYEMANGGIYDQIRGGFARYSVDAEWFAPHFEKMLYDNAQLVQLYAEAYSLTGNDYYKSIVEQTFDWLKNEMTSEEGGFYAALDADSEGEEGKFYVWNYEQFIEALGNKGDIMANYYNVVPKGNWEHGNNILHKNTSDEEFAEKYDLSLKELEKTVSSSQASLLKVRSKRIRPGLDDKILLGWNAMMSKGLIVAYDVSGDSKYLEAAEKNIQFIESKMRNGQELFRNYNNNKASITAYLEDYGLYIELLIAAYQSTFNESYLVNANELTNYVLEHFFDEDAGLFYYTNDSGEELIARKKEIFDNVIPSSNSIMAINLHHLGVILDNEKFKDISSKMLSKFSEIITTNTGYLSNWATLYSYKTDFVPEIVIIGEKSDEVRAEMAQHFIPDKVLLGSADSSDLPLLKGKYAIEGKTTIYVCFNKTCKLPVFTVEDALKQIKGN